MKKIFLTIIIFCLMIVPVFGATYYVCDDGTANWDATSGCSLISNCMSINEHNTDSSFASNVTGGDVVILCHQQGPFDDADELIPPTSGSPSSHIIYRGEANPGTSWHWQGTVTATDGAIYFDTKSYLNFEDLKIRYMAWGIRGVDNSDDIIIDNLETEFIVHSAIMGYVDNSEQGRGYCHDTTPGDNDCNDDWIIRDSSIRCASVSDGDAAVEPESAKRYRIGGQASILLCGPPGCGKTSMVRVAASEVSRLSGRHCQFFVVKPGEWESPWVGEAQANVRKCFQALHEAASEAMAVLFLDDVESVGRHRGGAASHHADKFTAAWLAELGPVSEMEDAMLDSAFSRQPNSRLSCQIEVADNLEGLTVQVAPNDA